MYSRTWPTKLPRYFAAVSSLWCACACAVVRVRFARALIQCGGLCGGHGAGAIHV
jgi:hypothetical protein